MEAGEITKEDYDRWRYNYPKYDTTQRWAKVPSKELSDALIKGLKKQRKDKITKKVLPTGESQQDLFLRIWRIYPQATRYTGVNKVNPVLVSAINLLSNAPFPL